MLFILTDSEAIDLLRTAVRRTDGLLAIDIPASRLQEAGEKMAVLTFSEESKTVHCGRLSVRLSPMQFALLRYVYERERASYEELQDAIWGGTTTDDAIRRIVSKLNTKLLEHGFPAELLSHHSRVSIERVA